MIRTSLMAGIAAFAMAPLAPTAAAQSSYGYTDGYNVQYNDSCARSNSDNRAAGALIGALAGGVLGVAIADNDDHYHRGHRGYRGHRGRWHRGHRGYRHNDDGDEIAGALIGGVLGAVVGSEIAGSASTDCRARDARYQRYVQDNIAPPTRQPFASSTGYQSVSTPAYPAAPAYPDVPLQGAPDEVFDGETLRCEALRRETRLPDGTLQQDPVTVCQMPDGQWQIQEGQPQY